MKRTTLCAAAVFALASGCGSRVRFEPNPAVATEYDEVAASSVRILESPVTVPHQELGELSVSVHSSFGVTDDEAVTALRAEAAERGCDAVVIRAQVQSRAGGTVTKYAPAPPVVERKLRADCLRLSGPG